MTNAVVADTAVETSPGSYLAAGHTLLSWLTTTDHKRIAILYAVSITLFFFIGGIAIALVRLELMTPQGLFLTSDAYNRLFSLHGIIMVWFFLVPSIPATMGNFLLPLMIGGHDVAFPRLNLFSWYLYVFGAAFTVYVLIEGGVDTGWTFYTPLSTNYAMVRHCRGGRRLCGRILLDRDRREFHCHRAHVARSRHDLVSPAAVRVGDVYREHGHGAGDAGAGDVASTGHRGTCVRVADFRCRPWRRPGPLPASVLVLQPPGRLHHDSSGHGRRIGGDPLREPSLATRSWSTL
jgi:hypothetical protein